MPPLTVWERRTGPWLTALALLSLVALVLDATWEAFTPAVRLLDFVAWAAFAADYLVRLRLAEHRWHFVRTHPVDLAAVVLPALRSLRLIAAIARVVTVTRRGFGSQVLATAVLTALAVVLAGAAAALDAERGAPDASIDTYPDALWWATTTITTVGYGDTYPVTGEGRVIAAILMLVGIATFGAVTAGIAATVVEQDLREEGGEASPQTEVADRLAAIEATLARLVDQRESANRTLLPPG